MEWWKKGNYEKNLYNDKRFQTILDFYLFHCPVEKKGKKVSNRAKSFEEYKIRDTGLTKLLNLMKKDFIAGTYRILKSEEDVEKVRIQLEKSSGLKDDYYEFIILKEDREIGKTRSIYYAIRNAFAHGSFSIKNTAKDRIYYFESSKDGKIKSQIRLKEKTLLNWITFIVEFSESQKDKLHFNEKSKKDKKIFKKQNV